MNRKQPVTNVAIADDHRMFREGIIAILSAFPEIKISVEGANGKELLDKLSHHKGPAPDVCLLDINMPEMNGYETLIALKENHPAVKTLIVSVFEKEPIIIKMLQAGANGYLTKNCDVAELRKAIVQVHQKGFYHSELATNTLHQKLQAREIKASSLINDNEIKFLSLCCTDMTYHEIAKQLYISTSTAEKWRDALFEKLNVHSRVGLAVFAITSGLYYIYPGA